MTSNVMAEEIHQRTVTIPAGTAKASLYVAPLVIPAGTVESIDLEVAPGPAYLMGFYLLNSGQQMIPMELGEFIVWDNTKDSWALDKYIQTGAWSLAGYNLDPINSHSVAVRFHTNSLTNSTPPAIVVNIVTTPIAQQPVTM